MVGSEKKPSNKQFIIAFGHRKGTGKDTLANFLITELRLKYPGISIIKLGFADKVKDIAFQIFAWAGLQPGDYYEENPHLKDIILSLINKTPRQLWIGVGNGVRQATGHDGTWSDYLFKTYIKYDVIVVKDLRFPKEGEDIQKAGGYCYRVDNPRCPKVTDGADDPLEGWEGWDGIINNSKDLSNLHNMALLLIRKRFA